MPPIWSEGAPLTDTGCFAHGGSPTSSGLLAPVRSRRERAVRRLAPRVRTRTPRRRPAWVNLLERLVVHLEPFGHALAEVLDEDVRALYQLVGDLATLGCLEVDGDAALAAVAGLEVGVPAGGRPASADSIRATALPTSPSRASILITSAPMSPIMDAATGPNCHIVQSRTLIPVRGPAAPLCPLTTVSPRVCCLSVF